MIIFRAIINAILHLCCKPQPTSEPAPLPSAAEIDAALAKRAQELGIEDFDKNSLTDTLAALRIPNMFHYRGGLYNELGGEGEYKGSAEQNVWMMQQVRRRFAEGRLD